MSVTAPVSGAEPGWLDGTVTATEGGAEVTLEPALVGDSCRRHQHTESQLGEDLRESLDRSQSLSLCLSFE